MINCWTLNFQLIQQTMGEKKQKKRKTKYFFLQINDFQTKIMFLKYVKNMIILEIKYLYFQVHKNFFSIQNSVQPHFPPESHSTKTKSKYTTYYNNNNFKKTIQNTDVQWKYMYWSIYNEYTFFLVIINT